jgi:hypothetical protein
MSIESALVTRLRAHAGLTAIIGGRVYGDVLPENATIPAIVYQRISTQYSKNAYGRNVGLYRPRFQLAIWATTKAVTIDAGLQIVDALDGHRDGTIGMATIEDTLDLYDAGASLYRRIVDVFLWHHD